MRHDNEFAPETAVIQLAPFSMKTFLLGKFADKPCCASSQSHDGFLAMSCVGYLSAGLPRPDVNMSDAALRTHPLLPYAARHWMSHSDRDHIDLREVISLVERFFSLQTSHEGMSLKLIWRKTIPHILRMKHHFNRPSPANAVAILHCSDRSTL